jgi:hypothetical protein
MQALLLLLLLVSTADAVCESHYPHKLDVAFYWARLGADDAPLVWEKSCPDLNTTAPGFDADRPSLLLVHGLQPGMVAAGTRFAVDGELDDVLRPYLQMGTNVGAFLWGQFGNHDVLKFVYTEDQIYTHDSFDKTGYVVQTRRGRLREANGARRTIPDYFIEAWRFHFPNGRTYPRVEVAGHSLGTQVALRAAYLLHTGHPSVDKKPDAVTLLDAVMSKSSKRHFERSPCGRTVSANMGCMARTLNLNHSVPIRYFKSSFINYCIFSAREDIDLVEYTAFATVKLSLYGRHPLQSCWDSRLLGSAHHLNKMIDKISYQMTMQHTMIIPYYLLSRFHPPHVCVVNRTASTPDRRACTPTAALALSAAMPDADVLGWSRPPAGLGRGAKLCFHEYDDFGDPAYNATGSHTMTLDPGDDLYLLRPCISTST